MQRVFRDRGVREAEFLSEFLVRCPRCDRRALVRTNGIPWQVTQAKLSCSACAYTAAWTAGRIRPPKRRCPKCGTSFQRRLRGSPTPREMHLHCPSCSTVVREPQSWMRLPGALTRDPYFGCMLWLIGDVKGEVFWAYNHAHLRFIRDYVGATLRIREPFKNGSMASRLPAFLLAKKNRDIVLKEIGRMEQA